jgi:hypothetical protein
LEILKQPPSGTGESMAEINYANALAQQQQRELDAEREQQEEIEWGKILSEYPLVNHAANRAEVRDWCQAQITLERFRFFMEKNPTALNLDWDIDAERGKLIAAICGAMHDPTEKRFTRFDEQQLRKALEYKSTSELREKLADVTRRQSMAKKSVTELKQDLKDMRAAETAGQRHPNYPQLPEKMYDSASRGWLVVDREYLQTLSRTDIYAFKRLAKLYGPYLDDRLNGRD